MDPGRKRRIRLVVALTAAVLLASALIYTSFSASSPAGPPRRLRGVPPAGRRVRRPGDRVPALGLLVRHGRRALVDDDAGLLQGRRRVVLAGGLAAAVGVPADDVVEPRALLHAQAHARR